MDINNSIYDKIISDDLKLTQMLAIWHFQNKKLVFTNGCFDILHRGHIEYLYQASLLGDVLILGLNTDNSVKQLKGSSRPLVDQESRAIVLSAMQFIDIVVFFDEDTPYNLIKKVQPDVLVKGGDYKEEDIVGYDIVMQKGGEVKTIPFIKGFSTTQIIEKLKQ